VTFRVCLVRGDYVERRMATGDDMTTTSPTRPSVLGWADLKTAARVEYVRGAAMTEVVR